MDSPTGPVPGRTAVPLDDTDRQILARLLKDARQSVRALAEQVHISRANAYTRIGRLLTEGVITGFTAQLNPKRAGLGTSAYVTLSTEQAAWRDISRELREIPYVEHVSLVTGDFDVLVLVRAPDNEALRSVVLESIQAVPGVRSTRTWLVFDEVRGRGADWTV
ncbi:MULTISPECIES: Lrp/AsnC family transcriptional regulator [Streptomyces]|uniref:Lrp/AsnC family transcriptional regulator n=1 Tax=Streptomyces caniscabiei TaxID=2746961 RepID=A0ABU4N484_9ACTN|nr:MULTISPECIES: Lrp/AsnC family transcriptional regulator [Streptomyces]MBE4739062.1 Lrp/AsnC family transcriptional regulator [Streptomyces caniscabiei]MBE4762668.1 Lrp/AsnC family transcriptional regulator [Streptomyces caniscabiei]MBE4772005.1 Lrp/AsnC family transcriptional regulator [Streptomyces caniscabiei]MBE4788066.1 Lrp/AsnC family transcriptional regulator [Streptomyces caniscabiei]MBE4797288.1 Lrp/AsnC family transcriptional regulator [Streptomyces caniscabiei]